MRLWGVGDVPPGGRSVVTIGVFDGVHRGQTIMRRAVDTGRELGLPVVVVTFEPHPDSVVRDQPHPMVLTPSERKAQLLTECGADAVCVLAFTRELSQLTAEDFVRQVLVEELHATAVVVGENFRFGHKAAGDLDTLHRLGEKYDFTAEGVRLVADADTITSTLIRRFVDEGDVVQAAAELGRPHRVQGVVVRGARRGRDLGFPTANLELPAHTAVPADGVYAGWLLRTPRAGEPPATGEARWPAAVSVGDNPTFGGQARTVEAYALDREDLDLYGEHMAVDFVARIRPMLRFSGVEELVAEMARDVERSRALLGA
ncbi:bifunctional riboflavin kinase/FAD synthetase [Spiractinospora alimapuensis]|uniref:bifunctional riboflavin kinase/FAD synthetase n=1 Tax=Spiractinospora alimapuensis TaxID=2820884 RepID=UPI001EEB0F6F|nr:bifunctional riboflavin kinase/FAD synthetase [Spiractinospora alimapuensis]QVQ53657.1 bifunctional riboflavin kinase/FAD synthetase [Spiractinospora alimapuensis]